MDKRKDKATTHQHISQGHQDVNSHNENLLLESFPGNNLTPRDLKSTDRFTAEESTMREREGKQIRDNIFERGVNRSRHRIFEERAVFSLKSHERRKVQ